MQPSGRGSANHLGLAFEQRKEHLSQSQVERAECRMEGPIVANGRLNSPVPHVQAWAASSRNQTFLPPPPITILLLARPPSLRPSYITRWTLFHPFVCQLTSAFASRVCCARCFLHSLSAGLTYIPCPAQLILFIVHPQDRVFVCSLLVLLFYRRALDNIAASQLCEKGNQHSHIRCIYWDKDPSASVTGPLQRYATTYA